MSQSTDKTLSPSISGTDQRTEINDIVAAILSGHSGASRAAYMTEAGTWTKEVSGTVHEIYYFDGDATDILVGTIDFSAETFTPAGQLATLGNTTSNKTAGFTAVNADYAKLFTCDATAAAFTAAIDTTATLDAGWYAIFQKTDATANAVTIDPASTNTVNGATTITLNRQYDAVLVLKTGATTFAALFLPNAGLYAPLANAALTGNPTAPTQSPQNNSTRLATTAYVDERGCPPGTGMDFWGTSLPTGWLWAAGQAVSRTTYANLFAAISTTFGVGDGSTTFNLPDKRGRASIGKDDMNGTSANRITTAESGIDGDVLGAAGGVEAHQLTAAEMAAHTHTASGTTGSDGAHTHGVPSDSVSGSDVSFAGRGQNSNDGNITTTSSGAHTHSVSLTTSSVGSDATHQNVQPSIVCNYIIKT